MVELLQGAGQCGRVRTSRQIVLPRVEDGSCLMVINATGKGAQRALDMLLEEGIIEDGRFEELDNHLYRIYLDKDKAHAIPDSMCLTTNEGCYRVFFIETAQQHEHHFGRCTPDGFACGLEDTNVWNKVFEGRSRSSVEFVVTRSYHHDCAPDWTYSEDGEVWLTPEQQAMMELGLPVNFGQSNRDIRRFNDEAVIADQDSQMVEKDYDKELAELSSSTEQMSLSRSSRPDSGEFAARLSPFCEPARGTSPPPLETAGDVDQLEVAGVAPNSMTLEAFDSYWVAHGNAIVEREWFKKYGDMMSQPEQETAPNEKHEEEPEPPAENSYEEEWNAAWLTFATEIYHCLMRKFVAVEELAGVASNGQDVQGLPCSEGSGETQEAARNGSEDEAGGGNAGGDDSSTRKRKLSLNDFGLATSADGACSVENVLVRPGQLKKLKGESRHHRERPTNRSADELNDGPNDRRLAKYWTQRYRLFHKFDCGIQLDDESWFSVTPEKIAEHIANRLCPRKRRRQMLTMDAFCGVGGNTIQLAKRCPAVLAVDVDPTKIRMAKHNAQIYGVDRRIEFVLADMNHFVPRIDPDVVFMSPPWGGPEYVDKPAFDLDDLCVDLRAIFRNYMTITPNLAFLLPRNVKIDQLCELGRVEVEQNLLNKKVKTITAYYGNTICK